MYDALDLEVYFTNHFSAFFSLNKHKKALCSWQNYMNDTKKQIFLRKFFFIRK